MSKTHKNYILQRSPIGAGGQAEVFAARHKQTGETVAFKRVKKDRQYHHDNIARMRREIDVQTKVKHLNVMPVFDYSDTYDWYTMPLARQIVSKLPIPIDETTLVQIIKHCAEGLKAAHEANYIHRDLTPSNILQIDEGGELRWVIADWGLVRQYGNTTVVRTLPNQEFGTIGYAAPELYLDAHRAGAPADIYSLGRIMVWCLTGQSLAPNIPAIPDGKWSDFIRATTSLEVAKRPQNVEEVLNWVESIEHPKDRPYIQSPSLPLKEVRPYKSSLQAFTIGGEKVIPRAWTDLLKATLNTIASREENFSRVMDLKDTGTRQPVLIKDSSKLSRPYLIEDTDIYVECKMGSQEIVNLLIAVTSLFNYPDSFVMVELKD